MGSTRYIPEQERGRVVSGPATALAVIGVSASVLACVAMSVSGGLHLFAGFGGAPVLGEAVASSEGSHATTASPVWLAVWNVLLPAAILVITLLTFRSWRKREKTSEYE